MKILILGFLAFLNLHNTSTLHDSVSATFNIIERGHILMLEIDFETFNFLKLEDAKNIKVTKEDLGEYLNKTTSWEIDGVKLFPQILKINSRDHHTKVICFLAKAKKNIKTIKIRNEFLLDIESHSNIVKLDLNDTFKDYNLNKERKEIEVVY